MKPTHLLAAILAASLITSSAGALEISDETNRNFEEYLKTIGSTKKGAFAVSEDGMYSWYIHCIDTNCLTGIGQEAVQKCTTLAGKPCSLMATGRDIRIPFTVVDLKTTADEETLAHILNGDQLKALTVGNTMEGEYPNNQSWVEYYDPSGEIRGKDDEHGSYKARYELKGDQICFDYPGGDSDWCGQISMRGNRIDYLEGGEIVNLIRNTLVLNGNPYGL